MRECSQCSYLLAPDWTTCRRCGASTPVAGAPPRSAPVAAPGSTPEPATQWGGPVVTAAPPNASYDPRYATPARVGFDAPGGTGDWSLPESTAPKGVTRKGRVPVRAAIVVFVAILLFGGFKFFTAWKGAPPKELAAYVDGEGVEYAPEGLGYSILLPEEPEATTQLQSVSGVEVQAHIAVADGEQWEMVAGALVVPFEIESTVSDEDLQSAAEGAISSMADLGAESEVVKTTTFAGHPALEVTTEASDGNPFEAKFILVGDTLYMYGVHATRGTDKIMDAMNASFELTDAGV